MIGFRKTKYLFVLAVVLQWDGTLNI